MMIILYFLLKPFLRFFQMSYDLFLLYKTNLCFTYIFSK
nr:MAG TPA: hypothetical protein [Bacteriophage sp.]